MTKKCFLLFCLLTTLQKGFAQEPFMKNIGINEGLPSTEVYATLQDKKGYMWFSSDAGVCRYNGHSFQYFTTANGLPDNSVFRLLEDKKGRIWMACYNGSICYYENGKINSIGASAELQKEVMNYSFLIISMQMDEEDTLWLGTTRTLYKVAPDGNYKKLIRDHFFDPHSLFVIRTLDNGGIVNSMYLNDPLNDRTAVQPTIDGYTFQVKSYNPKQNFSFTIFVNSYMPVIHSLLTKKGEVLMTYDNTLYRLNKKGVFSKKILPQTIISLTEDINRSVNIGLAKGGLYSFANEDLDSTPEIFLDKFSVSGSTIDFENGLWFTTLEKGVYYSPYNNYCRYYTIPGFCEKITGLGIADQKLMVANYNNEVFSLDSSGKVRDFPLYPETTGSVNYHFYSFGNKFYVCGTRISELDLRSGAVKFFITPENTAATGLGMIQTDEGKIACLIYGHYTLIENGILIRKFKLTSRPTCMIKASNGDILSGTLRGLFIKRDTSFELIKDAPELSEARVTCIAEKNNALFVTTKSKGLFIRENNKWSVINTSSGLPTDLCNAVLVDEDQTVWLATNKGIAFFKLTDRKKITTLTIADGLPTNEISSLIRIGKNLFAGTREGLCKIKLDQVFMNKVHPFIYLDRVTMNDSNCIVNGDHTFTYDQNNLALHLDRITYKGSSESLAYHLIGSDDPLKYSTNSVVEYSNLDPGRYVFEAYAFNNNGVRSERPVTFSFTIQKPWWNSWWFISVEILSLFAIVYLIILWRTKVVKKQEQEKRDVEKIIAEYQMTALQAQMNPHFIFNAINSIQNFILKNQTQPAYDYLAKFSKLIRLVLNNSKNKTITLEKELETLQLYIELEQLRFKESFDFKLNLNDNSFELSEIEIPTMLIQPYIENAIWHGIMPLENKRKGMIKLDIHLSDEILKISVEDNGVGRKFSEGNSKIKGHGSFGMNLVAQKIDIIERTTHQKTKVEIRDLCNTDGSASGTRIEIQIPNTVSK